MEKEMIPNSEHDRCACCGNGEGIIPINDENASYWICDYCNVEIFDEGLKPNEIRIMMKTLINSVKPQEIMV
jgi:hypothetical protein